MSEEYVDCRCGERHEVYEGFRECPVFNEQIMIAHRKSMLFPRHLLSTGKWRDIVVADEELGLKP